LELLGAALVNPHVLVVAVDLVIYVTEFLATITRLCHKKTRYFVQDGVSHPALLASELRERDFAFWAGVHKMNFREHRLFEAAE
jgi:hypothetical protein